MATLAILPVKSFSRAKQRLEHEVSAAVRRELAEAMFTDVLSALRCAENVGEIVVISAEQRARRIAAAHDADFLEDRERGHNPAATAGIDAALQRGADGALLIAGDLPAVKPAEIDALLAHPVDPPGAVVVPDRHGTGTNALLLRPPDALVPAFGPGSCERHLARAEEHGVDAALLELPSLALDLDTREDLRALEPVLASAEDLAARTRAVLGELLARRS